MNKAVDVVPKQSELKKLIVHDRFNETARDLLASRISLPLSHINMQGGIDSPFYSPASGKLAIVGELLSKQGCTQSPIQSALEGRPIAGYDESINRFDCLEGSAYYTVHTLVDVKEDDYYPTCFLTFYFYTRARDLAAASPNIKLSNDPELDSKRDYVKDKIDFLAEHTPPGSILLIDGPLIGGDVYTYMMHALDRFLENNVIVLFFVKNSSSNLVTENIPALKGKYNSDMHWAHRFLRPGEATTYFLYTDAYNPENQKIFCYLKAYDLSPQRIEMHRRTFEIYKDVQPELLSLVYRLIMVQGKKDNPQVRPIAIAEEYSRAILHMANMTKAMEEVGVTPTMNQVRFGWS